jgi:hypothetical protein
MKPQISCGAWLERFTKVQAWGAAGVAILLVGCSHRAPPMAGAGQPKVTPLQMAQYAVAVRTAMIVDFFLPALNLTGGDLMSAAQPLPASQRTLIRQLAAALFYSCALVMPLLVLARTTLANTLVKGQDYSSFANISAYAIAARLP